MPEQFGVRTGGGDFAVIHHKDEVGMLDRCDTLRDNNLGGFGNIASEAGTNEGIGFGKYNESIDYSERGIR